jgi:uncharacterized membrane protein
MKMPWVSIVLSAISLVFVCVVYTSLPAIIPIHWGLNGEVNGTAPRAIIFLLGVMPLGMAIFLSLIPKIDPKQDSWARHEKPYRIVIFTITLLLIAVSWLIILASWGVPLKTEKISMLLAGAVFVVFGNLMPRFRHNYLLGIRTPWTLADEGTWQKTHRMGGYAFILMGLCFIVPSLMPGGGPVKWIVGFSLFFALLLAIFIYSWAVFPKKKEN